MELIEDLLFSISTYFFFLEGKMIEEATGKSGRDKERVEYHQGSFLNTLNKVMTSHPEVSIADQTWGR